MSYDPDNVFARVIRGELPSDRVYEDAEFLAFRDISPAAPVHIIIVPRRAGVGSTADLTDGDAEWAGRMLVLASRIAREQGVEAGGYRLLFNCGADGGQTVPHLHLHLLGGRTLHGFG